MKNRIIIPIFVILIIALSFLSMIFIKKFVDYYAEWQARKFLSAIDGTHRTKYRIVSISDRVFDEYSKSQAEKSETFFLQLRHYLSSSLLPDAIRLDQGAVNFLLLDGHCDDIARALAYILERDGIPSEQLNVILPYAGAHTIVLATLEGETYPLDPQFGLVPMQDGELLPLSKLPAAYSGGRDGRQIWTPLSPSGTYHPLYDEFDDAYLSRQGSPIELIFSPDFRGRDRIELGRMNHSSDDVADDGKSEGLSVYWHYLGHRFDRGWTRVLKAPVAMRVTFDTVEDIWPGLLTAGRPPTGLSDRKLWYDLAVGDTLELTDGTATRNFWKLRSYVDVDRITLEKLPVAVQ